MRVLTITADGFEDLELFVPYYRLLEVKQDVDIASLEAGRVRGKHGYEVDVTLPIAQVDPSDYDALLLPGGNAPELLRQEGAVLDAAAHFMVAGKPVAAICHGPQILAAAGVLKGRRLTCYPAVAGDVKEAGGEYQDQEVIIDGNLVTSRTPRDLPAFLRETTRLFTLV